MWFCHCFFFSCHRMAERKKWSHALKIDNMDMVEELNLPPVKIHCSVLAEDAIKAAINDYHVKAVKN